MVVGQDFPDEVSVKNPPGKKVSGRAGLEIRRQFLPHGQRTGAGLTGDRDRQPRDAIRWRLGHAAPRSEVRTDEGQALFQTELCVIHNRQILAPIWRPHTSRLGSQRGSTPSAKRLLRDSRTIVGSNPLAE
jgi:hypothetical protein